MVACDAPFPPQMLPVSEEDLLLFQTMSKDATLVSIKTVRMIAHIL